MNFICLHILQFNHYLFNVYLWMCGHFLQLLFIIDRFATIIMFVIANSWCIIDSANEVCDHAQEDEVSFHKDTSRETKRVWKEENFKLERWFYIYGLHAIINHKTLCFKCYEIVENLRHFCFWVICLKDLEDDLLEHG